MEKELYYLATPFKGTPQEEAHRLDMSLTITQKFLKQGVYLFSPIVYTNPLIKTGGFLSTEDQRSIIMPYLLAFLNASKGMVLITLDGWKKSWGVNQELLFCQEHKIPVYLMAPDQLSQEPSEILSTPLNPQQMAHLLEAA